MTDPVDDALAALSRMTPVDLAPKLQRGIPLWPSHPQLVIDPTKRHDRDGYFCQTISMAEHTGAHVDAPAHIHADRMRETVDVIAPDRLIARAVIYDFSDRALGPGQTLSAADIRAKEKATGIAAGEGTIALVNFGWLARHWATDARAHYYAENSPGMTEDAAELFRDRGVRAVGADTIACETPIVDGVPGDAPGHRTHWLPNGILILECLANLHAIGRTCLFVAAPLPIVGGSGSPLRPLAYVAT